MPVTYDPIEPADLDATMGTEVGQVIEQFLTYQRGRGFSEATVKRRGLTLRALERHLAPLGLADATTVDLEEWLAAKRAARTRHAYRSDVRVFYTWAYRRGLIDHDPTVPIDSVKVPRALPRPLGPEAVGLLDHGSRQTRQMVALALYAGLRCAEIAALRAEDVWLLGDDDSVVIVRNGKGGKDRVVPISHELRQALEPLPASGPLFPGRGHPTVLPGTVSARIARHLARCGIDATPHQLRHTFGTAVARRSGGDVVLTAAWMGHESTDTTMGYIRLSAGRGREFIEDLYGGGDAA